VKRPLTYVLAFVVLGALIAGSVLWPRPARDPAPPIPLPVSRLLACPAGDPAYGKTAVTVTDQTTFLGGPVNAAPGPPTTSASFDNPAVPIVVRGSASMGGLSTYTEGGHVLAVPCLPPITAGTWGGVLPGPQATTLILSNVDVSPAMVDVFLYDETGPIAMAGLVDITVAPGGTQMLAIDTLVPQETTPFAVSIRTSRGRVLAVMRTTGAQGYDWSLPQVYADTSLVISGIPAGNGTRTLSLTNADPANSATAVLEVMSPGGAFAPLGLESVTVPPARTLTVDVTSAFGGQAAAIRLTANRPVSATVTVLDKDIAAVSAQPGLNGTVVFPSVAGTLVMANPGKTAAVVTLRTSDAQGVVQSTDTPVPPGGTATVEVPGGGQWSQVSSPVADVRVALVLPEASAAILPLIGGGASASVPAPRYDPGLG